MLEGYHWKSWNHSWEKQLARIMNKTGVNAVILELAVSHDPLNSSKSIIEVCSHKVALHINLVRKKTIVFI